MKKVFALIALLGLGSFVQADLQIEDVGTVSLTKAVGAATNANVFTYTNNSIHSLTICQLDLSYKASDNSTTTVSIADSLGNATTWFSVTNSSTTFKSVIPVTQYHILPSNILVVSNSVITANTNIIKILLGATFKP